MTKKYKYITLFSIVLTAAFLLHFSFRGKRTLSPQEYALYIENPDNGLCVKKQIDKFEFTLQYKPVEYIALIETKDVHITTATLNQKKEELGKMQYFTLKVKANNADEFLKSGIATEEEYFQRLEYFMSMAQDDISLIDGKDTLACALYHYERNYGIAPVNNIVLAFPSSIQTNTTKTFVYDDKVLGTGKLQIEINSTHINKIPQLKTY